MKGSFALGSIRGIRIEIDIGLVLIFGLFTFTLAAINFPQTHPAWDPTLRWIVACFIALMFFMSVLLHELLHSFVTNSLGMTVRVIRLFVFKGVTLIEGKPSEPMMELKMAIAGPAMSIFLYMLLMLFAKIWGSLGAPEAVKISLVYSAQINLILAISNLVPAFPLDGGRVLRAVIWYFKGDFPSATRIAVTIGNVIGYLLMIIGAYLILTGDYLYAICFVFAGWYIHRLSSSGTNI